MSGQWIDGGTMVVANDCDEYRLGMDDGLQFRNHPDRESMEHVARRKAKENDRYWQGFLAGLCQWS